MTVTGQDTTRPASSRVNVFNRSVALALTGMGVGGAAFLVRG
jgi:hypothetical protein